MKDWKSTVLAAFASDLFSSRAENNEVESIDERGNQVLNKVSGVLFQFVSFFDVKAACQQHPCTVNQQHPWPL